MESTSTMKRKFIYLKVMGIIFTCGRGIKKKQNKKTLTDVLERRRIKVLLLPPKMIMIIVIVISIMDKTWILPVETTVVSSS